MFNLQDAVVIHIGCGMDSRILRVGTMNHKWYDVDFADVIEERKKYYSETADYQMIAGDARDCKLLKTINENSSAIVVMEVVSMYLTVTDMKKLTDSLCAHFEDITFLVDCYTSFAAGMSKYRNPIKNEVTVNSDFNQFVRTVYITHSVHRKNVTLILTEFYFLSLRSSALYVIMTKVLLLGDYYERIVFRLYCRHN